MDACRYRKEEMTAMETKEKVVNQEPVDGFSEVFGHFDEGRAGRGYTAEEGGFSVPAKSLKIFLFFHPPLIQLQFSCIELVVDSFFFD